jgi:hypothetical protein
MIAVLIDAAIVVGVCALVVGWIFWYNLRP